MLIRTSSRSARPLSRVLAATLSPEIVLTQAKPELIYIFMLCFMFIWTTSRSA